MSDTYYAKTAYNSEKPRKLKPDSIADLDYSARRWFKNPFENAPGVHCREFIGRMDEVYFIRLLNSGKKEIEEDLKKPIHKIYVFETLNNPKVVLKGFSGVMGIFSVIFWFGFALMIIIALLMGGSWWFGTEHFFYTLLFPIAPTLLYFLSKLILRTGKIKDKNNILFNRQKGMIIIPRKKQDSWELPFDEFDPYWATSVNPSASEDYHLFMGNRYNGAIVKHPSGYCEIDQWFLNLEWEFLQQYMDISKPLPDIPSLEPFRHNDPVTAAYDQKHNRPPRYWRDMDLEKAEKLHKAAVKAAKSYPWGLTREQAMAQGWQPSGVGEGDWMQTK